MPTGHLIGATQDIAAQVLAEVAIANDQSDDGQDVASLFRRADLMPTYRKKTADEVP
ncbi:hypothetical protein [Pseudonocardia alaniniphila]|uniref:Uncharacterized protein n=1 Tax=Pseudonocardia alaniniphila TaxID=75291 RepID=A0ABS9TQK0_9PSEU|nr:hypothetical protein [Pseudonocardia alaniniphila]MCH6170824.1 hypothetical protein [Pseudonocardia alaniniphila]